MGANRSIVGCCLILLGCLTCGPVASDTPPAPAMYLACISCHGEDGWGSPAIRAPAIAGQQQAYLEKQLNDYRSGARGGHSEDKWGAQMALMSLPLTDDDVLVLAEYLARQPLWPVKLPGEQAVPPAAQSCLGCHPRESSQWSSSGAPILWGLSADYLYRQLLAYQSGWRGRTAGEGISDAMAAAVDPSLSTETLMTIARYFANE